MANAGSGSGPVRKGWAKCSLGGRGFLFGEQKVGKCGRCSAQGVSENGGPLRDSSEEREGPSTDLSVIFNRLQKVSNQC